MGDIEPQLMHFNPPFLSQDLTKEDTNGKERGNWDKMYVFI
jgi:hypothetical protein